MKPHFQLLFLALATLFPACNKDKTNTPLPKQMLLAKAIHSYDGTVVTYTYDDQQRMKTEEVLKKAPAVNSTKTIFLYDGQGRLAEQVTDYKDPGAADQKAAYTYAANGAVQRVTYYNGPDFKTPVRTYEYAYAADELTKIWRNAAGTPSYKWITRFETGKRNVTTVKGYRLTGVTEILEETTTYSDYDDKKAVASCYPRESRPEGSENNYRRLQGTDHTNGSTDEYVYSYEYNAQGYVTLLRSGSSTVTYEYTTPD